MSKKAPYIVYRTCKVDGLELGPCEDDACSNKRHFWTVNKLDGPGAWYPGDYSWLSDHYSEDHARLAAAAYETAGK